MLVLDCTHPGATNQHGASVLKPSEDGYTEIVVLAKVSLLQVLTSAEHGPSDEGRPEDD